MLYSANTGSTAGDDDRRHIFRADVASGSVTQLTHGASSETNPVSLENGAIAFNRATAQQPLLVTLQTGDAQRALDANLVASDFPASELIAPREVSFRAPDGIADSRPTLRTAPVAASIRELSSCTAVRRARCC